MVQTVFLSVNFELFFIKRKTKNELENLELVKYILVIKKKTKFWAKIIKTKTKNNHY